MKITDLSIKSNNIKITELSKQEAHKVVGGRNLDISQINAGVPRTGGTRSSSCHAGWFYSSSLSKLTLG